MGTDNDFWRGEDRTPDEAAKQRAYELAALDRRAREYVVILQNHVTSEPVKVPRDATPHECPICGRRRLKGEDGFWQHVRMVHGMDGIRQLQHQAPVIHEEGSFEDALIRIVNSLSHDEAVKIATAALLGEG